MDEYIDAHGWTGSMNPSVDRPVGRQMNFLHRFLSILQTAPPPGLGSVLHGQHPHNSVYVIYLSVSTQTTFNLSLLPLHMSIETPTFIHAHADLSCISYFRKRKMCSQRLQPLTLPSFPPHFCVNTSNNKIYCQDLV